MFGGVLLEEISLFSLLPDPQPYDIKASDINISICDSIIKDKIKSKLSDKAFAENLGVSLEQLETWTSGHHDFSIKEICFLNENLFGKESFEFIYKGL